MAPWARGVPRLGAWRAPRRPRAMALSVFLPLAQAWRRGRAGGPHDCSLPRAAARRARAASGASAVGAGRRRASRARARPAVIKRRAQLKKTCQIYLFKHAVHSTPDAESDGPGWVFSPCSALPIRARGAVRQRQRHHITIAPPWPSERKETYKTGGTAINPRPCRELAAWRQRMPSRPCCPRPSCCPPPPRALR